MSKVQWMSKDLWIIAAGFIAAMHIGKLPATLPILQQQMQISLVQGGLLLSLVQGAGMCFALVLGSYAEKIGLKRCLVFGLGLLIASSLIAMSFPALWLMFLTRALEGSGFLMVTLTGAAIIRQLVQPEQLAAKMGLWTAYMGGGIAIALVLAPMILHLGSWQWVWAIFAFITLGVLLGVAFFIPATQKSTQSVKLSQLIQTTIKHPPAWYLALIFGAYAGQWFALVSFLPIIYAENHIALTTAGLLTATVSIANAVGTFSCGLLLQRGISAKLLMQFGFAILAFCALSFYGLKDFLPFIVQFALVFAFSLFGGLVAATVFAQALHFAPSPQTISTTIGLILQNSAFSQFALPPLIAFTVSQAQTWLWAGMMMAILSMIGIVLAQRLFQLKQV